MLHSSSAPALLCDPGPASRLLWTGDLLWSQSGRVNSCKFLVMLKHTEGYEERGQWLPEAKSEFQTFWILYTYPVLSVTCGHHGFIIH